MLGREKEEEDRLSNTKTRANQKLNVNQNVGDIRDGIRCNAVALGHPLKKVTNTTAQRY